MAFSKWALKITCICKCCLMTSRLFPKLPTQACEAGTPFTSLSGIVQLSELCQLVFEQLCMNPVLSEMIYIINHLGNLA